jgi:hypothetical protein
MIFSQYRESVYEITEMLNRHECIKPMEFVGQSSTGGRKTITQKEQLSVKNPNLFLNVYKYMFIENKRSLKNSAKVATTL